MRFEVKTMLPVLLAAALLAAAADAADVPKAQVNCRNCHTTGTPTKEKPALIKCPRAKVQGFHSIDEAVKTVVFAGKAEYGPVKFSHKAHAEMAEMGEGCGSCHHYNQARSIQKCGECHSPARLREGEALGKPDLQGAQHRRCISCHQSWGGDAKCGSCHVVKGRAPAAPPKALAPERVLFGAVAGKRVDFPHKAHVEMYGLKCAECHKGSSCSDCHGSGKGSVSGTLKAASDAPASCLKCHADGVPGKRR